MTVIEKSAIEKKLVGPRRVCHPRFGFIGTVTRFCPIDAPVWWQAANRKGRTMGEFRTAKKAVHFLEYSAEWHAEALDLEPVQATKL